MFRWSIIFTFVLPFFSVATAAERGAGVKFIGTVYHYDRLNSSWDSGVLTKKTPVGAWKLEFSTDAIRIASFKIENDRSFLDLKKEVVDLEHPFPERAQLDDSDYRDGLELLLSLPFWREGKCFARHFKIRSVNLELSLSEVYDSDVVDVRCVH